MIFFKLFRNIVSYFLYLSLIIAIIITVVVVIFNQNLPNKISLKNYFPPSATVVYDQNHHVITSYFKENRNYVPSKFIPSMVKNAFISAEDANFYNHHGIDIEAILRASIANLVTVLQGHKKRFEGASTITQQLTKNLLLNNEYSFSRKIKEALLAMKLERALSKKKILELYLNVIYMGRGSYGIKVASRKYFNKDINQLNISEAALLAGLVKSPRNYNPFLYPINAIKRRNWVLNQMYDKGYITEDQLQIALHKKLSLSHISRNDRQKGKKYFLSAVLDQFLKKYSLKDLDTKAYKIETSLDPDIQAQLVKSLRFGIQRYDKRHGYRGPLQNLSTSTYIANFKDMKLPLGALDNWSLALVTKSSEKTIEAILTNGDNIIIPLKQLKWARKFITRSKIGKSITKANQVLSVGDVILVSKQNKEIYSLQQIPLINGAVIAFNPHSGNIKGLVGGWSFKQNQFNRATQSIRQLGSLIKPLVYSVFMEKGLQPNFLVIDEPFILNMPDGSTWRPNNFANRFRGPVTIQRGLEHSLNIPTIRSSAYVGLNNIKKYLIAYGLYNKLTMTPSVVIGARGTSLKKLMDGFATLFNRGKKVKLTLINQIKDKNNNVIFRNDNISCKETDIKNYKYPICEAKGKTVISATSTRQVISMMEGTVKRGTARSLKNLKLNIAAKTGTSNLAQDVLFLGATPSLIIGIRLGFDDVQALGLFLGIYQESGSSDALPVYKNFIKNYKKNIDSKTPFQADDNINYVRNNYISGKIAQMNDKNVELQAINKNHTLKYQKNTKKIPFIH